jgi:diguanylate cyclase
VLARRSNAIIGVASAALVVFAGWRMMHWDDPASGAAISAIGSLCFSLFALVCALAVVRANSGRRRAAWASLAVGLCGWVVGDLIWAYHRIVLGTLPDFPSIIDVGYLLLPVATILTWTLSAPDGKKLLGLRTLLDGVITACALLLMAWVLILQDLLQDRNLNGWQFAVSLAYPVLDIIMITITLVVMSKAQPATRKTIGLVAAGLFSIGIGDSTLVYINLHDMRTSVIVTTAWSLGMVLIGAGALSAIAATKRRDPLDEAAPRSLFWLPYVPMIFAVPISVHALWNFSPGDRPLLLAGVVLIAAAMARQLTVLLENRALLEAVADQALRDPLTGLANRLLFTDRLTHAMQLRERDGREVSVLSLDLDDFKMVNDNMGHQAGDSLLRSVADRLVAVVPAGDTVSRLGGDEFAVVIEDGPAIAEHLAQRVVEVFDKPFFLDGEELYIHPSVGLATAPSSNTADVTADDLFKQADLAMYSAKRAGVGGVHSYSPDMQLVDRAELRTTVSDNGKRRRAPVAGIQLLGQLRRAIEDGDLALVYQPKISLATGGIVGVEALIRWPHPELGLLTPNQFLPLVRQNGLMGAVTDLVLDQAVADAVTWYAAGTCDLPVAINLFAPSLNDLGLPDRILSALKRAGLPPTALSVEITEHLLVANIRRATTVIDRLRANGLRTAIDDFGSGYATMSYLRDLPIDELKLDRQFIAPVLRSERAAAIVRSVIDLAHTLGIACVAEGVEDKATADRLRDYGCDIAQGHYFSRPIPADALRDVCQPGISSSAIFPITS